MKHFGFTEEVDLVEQWQCPLCKEDIVPLIGSFTNQESFKEYQISGLCQECQDSIFSDSERRCVQCSKYLKNNSDYTLAILYYRSVEGKMTYLCQDCLERGLQYNRNLIDQFIGLFESSLTMVELYAPESGPKLWKGSIIESSTAATHFKADTLYLLACGMITMITK